ncbi:conserved hypothetical protein [Theileria equi strain WA]|uniref:DUF4149 domain-containing protein n=1 Tax=Theileria equi strain WA TaxID=1537102 RepID=L1LDL6_THEEQ|nr:conserved hypothetical protein [Theileria equi strain WA]EKX73364.1 conserved hypothetical protein [Theileria equi strain WA]|eukprot:XP_004832816.1 conserved hypothetical protein [Theileria equi strain WA]
MAGGLLSTLRFGFLTGGVGLAFSPYLLKVFRPSPAVLRLILNVSWGAVFGSHFWFLFISKRGIPDGEGDHLLENKGVTDLYKFHFLSILGSGLLLFSISGLAPTYHKFRICAYVSLCASILGLGIKWLEDADDEPKGIAKILSRRAFSKFFQLTTFLSVTAFALS